MPGRLSLPFLALALCLLLPSVLPFTTTPSSFVSNKLPKNDVKKKSSSSSSSSSSSRLDTVVRAIDPSSLDTIQEVTKEQILIGFIAGVFPFVWASWEFWKRIDTQQRCEVCNGSGLVSFNQAGKELRMERKCYACGGFLPWKGWRRFWLANLDIGNGGVLQRPARNFEELSAQARRQKNMGEVPTGFIDDMYQEKKEEL